MYRFLRDVNFTNFTKVSASMKNLVLEKALLKTKYFPAARIQLLYTFRVQLLLYYVDFVYWMSVKLWKES